MSAFLPVDLRTSNPLLRLGITFDDGHEFDKSVLLLLKAIFVFEEAFRPANGLNLEAETQWDSLWCEQEN